jgi:hypothetical protein
MNRATFRALLALGWLLSPVVAKTFFGDFQLSPEQSGQILGSFALAPGHKGDVKLILSTPEKPYEDDRAVRLRIFKDDTYTQYQAASTCYEKITKTSFSEPVKFSKNDGLNVYDFQLGLDATWLSRPHYYYFVVDDCSLEVYHGDGEIIPRIHYRLETMNGQSHLSADEMHLQGMYSINLLVSGVLAALMGIIILRQLSHNSSIHAAMLFVMSAGLCDAGSSICEILNLSIYSRTGIGSPVLECLASHLEAVCDSLIALVLLSIAAGWTLPSEVIPMQQHAGSNSVKTLLGGFQSPVKALQAGSPTAMLTILVFVAHIVLAQWGCALDGNFDSYHDFAHLPGKLLMGLRILMGLCLIVCCLQTRMRCPFGMQKFYLRLAVVGTLWFQSLPLVTFACNHVVPYYLRHWTVGTWASVLHCTSIALLSWLVATQNQSFQKYCTELPGHHMFMSSSMPMKFGRGKIRLE